GAARSRTPSKQPHTFKTKRNPSFSAACQTLRILQHYGFEYVGYVFCLVSREFEELDQFLGLDERDGVFFLVEELADGGARDDVGFVFQAVDLDAVAKDVAVLAEKSHCTLQFLALQEDDARQVERDRRRLGDAVHEDARAGGIEKIKDV